MKDYMGNTISPGDVFLANSRSYSELTGPYMCTGYTPKGIRSNGGVYFGNQVVVITDAYKNQNPVEYSNLLKQYSGDIQNAKPITKTQLKRFARASYGASRDGLVIVVHTGRFESPMKFSVASEVSAILANQGVSQVRCFYKSFKHEHWYKGVLKTGISMYDVRRFNEDKENYVRVVKSGLHGDTYGTTKNCLTWKHIQETGILESMTLIKTDKTTESEYYMVTVPKDQVKSFIEKHRIILAQMEMKALGL